MSFTKENISGCLRIWRIPLVIAITPYGIQLLTVEISVTTLRLIRCMIESYKVRSQTIETVFANTKEYRIRYKLYWGLKCADIWVRLKLIDMNLKN